MTITEDLDQLRKESEGKAAEAARLQALHAEFPDLQKRVGRWKKVAYFSKTANPLVKRFDIRHNCGCCNDSPLEIWPYVESPHGNVYSDPPMFQVGERHWISGDTPYPGWKGKMKEAGIPEDIIGAVGMHFKQCAEARREIAAADDYEDDED